MIIPDDIETLKYWFPVIRHARAVAKQSSGLGIITIRVVVNEIGQPAGLWVMPTMELLVPRSTADLALREILDKLTIK